MTTYCIYLLQCADGSYYCGITTDMDRRLNQHNSGIGSRYVRSRLPATVLHRTDYVYTRSDALKIEYQVKCQKKSDKLGKLKEY